jgi:ABC-type transport system involved in multi-copper enzyme maturation permease subunit
MLKNEIIKIFKYKYINIGLMSSLIFSVLFSLLGLRNENSYYAMMGVFSNINKLYILFLCMIFSTYIFGIEKDCKTIKIIKTKSIKAWKFIGAKYIVGLIYSFIILSIMFIISYIISMLVLHPDNISLIQNDGSKLPLANELVLGEILKLYFYQFIANAFIISVSLLFGNIINSPALAFISTFVFMILLNLLTNIKKFGLGLLVDILPLKSNALFEFYFGNFNDKSPFFLRMIVFIFYSILILMVNIYIYNKKEVKT